jgi:hypothetical protein
MGLSWDKSCNESASETVGATASLPLTESGPLSMRFMSFHPDLGSFFERGAGTSAREIGSGAYTFLGSTNVVAIRYW